MSHRDSVVAPPAGARVVASSPSTPIAAFEDAERGLYGVQFHPEVVHTPHGMEMLKNFLYDVADAPPLWTPAAVIEEEVARIRAQVGRERVLCALSGGVDSAVAALLVYKAVGDQLTCVFVDHGLLRKGEADQVVETFSSALPRPARPRRRARALPRAGSPASRIPRRSARSSARSSSASSSRRRASSAAFRYLVQGTLYSDVIESGGTGGVAAKIKSHHNVGGLPEDIDFELVEPLRMLFKDEVRRVGEELGLPEAMVWRHPFPGPGLAIRIIGEVTRERLEILREADAILLEEIRRAGLYRELWQCFAVLPAIRSVGVQGDERTYAYPIVIRAVTSEDAMTADWARLPYDLLEAISTRIINEIPARQPRRPRHLLEAAGDDRVGVSAAERPARPAATRQEPGGAGVATPDSSGRRLGGAVGSHHGVPPDRGAAAVRLRGDRQAEARAAPGRGGRDRPRLREPRHPVAGDAVEKLCEAAQQGAQPPLLREPRASRSCARRSATSTARNWGVELDPETQAITTIGAKEGLCHLMWVLLQPGDSAVVPSPSYPIHIWGPVLAGAEVARVAMGPDEDLFGNLVETFERSWPRPRVIILSFPHNPTTATVDLEFMQRAVDFARENEVADRPRLRLRRSRLRRLRSRRRSSRSRARRRSPSSCTR